MADRLRIVVAQYNPTVGALQENASRALSFVHRAAEAEADLVVFPEMSIGGYQLQDLVDKPAFIASCDATARALARSCADGPAVLIGLPVQEGEAIYNAAYLLEAGEVRTIFKKHELPNYGVFDEKRLYTPGPAPGPVEIKGARIGVAICEDAWFPDVAETLQESGAELLVVMNGSPYARDKYERRLQNMVARVVETDLPLLYVNLVGGQDDQVFDGGSFALTADRRLAMQAPFFEEALTVTDWTREGEGWQIAAPKRAPLLDEIEADYRAMCLATRDYVHKNGFERVVLGLSGGVDSAIVATIAADALGPENVWCIMLPSKFTSDASLEDAAALAMAQDKPLL